MPANWIKLYLFKPLSYNLIQSETSFVHTGMCVLARVCLFGAISGLKIREE